MVHDRVLTKLSLRTILIGATSYMYICVFVYYNFVRNDISKVSLYKVVCGGTPKS